MANLIRVGGGGGGSSTLITKSITQNGTYLAQDDNADGYSEVSVDVESETRTVFNTVNLYSGKITNTTGVVVEDSNYVYTDYLPLPEGDSTWYGVTFDLGLNSSQTYAGLTLYNEDKSYNNYWNPNARFRFVDTRTQYAQGARWFRLSFPVANLKYAMAHSWGDGIVYSADEPSWITNEAEGVQYVDISSFAHYYKRNTTTPTITPISSTEVSLTFQNQNATGYELCSFSVPLTKGIYVAEIYATLDKNTGLAGRYTWGIYSSNTSGGASMNDNSPLDNTAYDTYVPFDKSDTNEHYYEVPIKVLADGTAYICFAMTDDNGVNATITVRSLKIRKAYGSSGSSIPTLKLNEGYLDVRTGVISADSNYYYSDPFPCPMATAFFDVGESSSGSTLGFAIYDPNDVHTEFFTANARHRTVNIITYIPDPTGYTCRLSFAKSHLTDLLFRDISANILYANADFVTVNE